MHLQVVLSYAHLSQHVQLRAQPSPHTYSFIFIPCLGSQHHDPPSCKGLEIWNLPPPAHHVSNTSSSEMLCPVNPVFHENFSGTRPF